MTFNFKSLPIHRSHQVLRSVWEISFQRWPGSTAGGVLSREWLRRFLLLKLLTVLLFPHGAGLPLLVGCVFSLHAFLLLRSPHISTKPSTVLLGQLARTDGVVLLQWALRLGATLGHWVEDSGCVGEMKGGRPVWWREAVSVLCQQLLDAHHLASLLLLGLLGLEATLVSRWPQQTRRFRTSHWAQISCGLVWTLVLLELVSLLYLKLVQDLRHETYPTALQDSQTFSLGLPTFCLCLRRMLWLVNSWLHYAVFNSKPQRRKSSFH
ncbi:uncharacterized protein LOC103366844 [Stegastes partitus]|uniref:Uncharacterized protein LOC103366844 n=1 Tax=Stegastes partitus TaxID=144197 RepID=A0A9Y4KFS4_9TELE|nr:PREDICTED: uncharacterized protein LOC103366844 [Stegastes partitus]